MKKVLWLIVCLMTMVVSASAQEFKDVKYHKIKEAAVEGFRKNLFAPTQFVLADRSGKKITIDDLYVKVEEETSEIITQTKIDSVITYKKIYEKCWVVLVEGDAMNRMGGYKHTSDIVYVYGLEDYAYANYPYNEKRYKLEKIKAEPIENTNAINWKNEHAKKHTKGIDIPFRYKSLDFGSLLAFTHILCPFCQKEYEDLGETDYKKLVDIRRKCKEYKEHEKEEKQKRKEKDKERKENRISKINKYLSNNEKITIDDMYY